MATHSPHLRTVGQTYNQFKLVKSTEVPELQCTIRELIHEPSGAKIMHIGNDDPENLFCLTFQTLPHNSKGVAHILEHTVLCGSEKYPVKDPFFAMNRRSLNTFMNALTGADFTCYPASSQVHKDFYNLLEVYLDAVFHPLLDRFSFLQEGHRLEFTNPLDPESPLEWKGIVYNEMKGALSSASSRLSEAMNQSLFPDVTYGFNSGGDPSDIPHLTYEELKQFYETYYHPSRCLFFFYGNLPLEPHLDFIAKHTLNHTIKFPNLPPIPHQKRFKTPVKREISYPIAPEEDIQEKSMVALGWLTCSILEQEETLALSILEIILMDTDASPLKMALLQSGLCKQAQSFVDVELNEIPWGIVLKGCDAENSDAIEKLIKETLSFIASTGIPLEMIENAIHQLEFHRSEITGDHAPFGLALFMRSGLLKQHGADPAEGLMIHSLFDRLRKINLANPNYFNDLIRKYLLDNPHCVRIVMKPDPLLGAKELQDERDLLAKLKSSLTPKECQNLVDQAIQLSEFQKKQEEEDIEVLPKVALTDIPAAARDYTLTEEKVGNLTVFHHAVFTNEIVYADLIFDLPKLKEEDLVYLRLYTIVLPQIGCGGRTYQENLEYIQGNTGGIGAGISLNINAVDHRKFSPALHLRGKALHRKVGKLFPLLHETADSAELNDLKRLREILFKHYTGLETRLTQTALKYAINLSASGLNVASKIADDLYGLSYFWKVRDIVADFDRQGPFILSKLQEIQDKVMCLDKPHLVLSCDNPMYNQLKSHGFYGLKDIVTSSFTPWKEDFNVLPVIPQGRIIASPVAFIGKVFPTVSYTHPDAPALNIASFLFDNLTLHAKIREQGGAYGGGAVSNPLSGNFYFYSYRDPNVLSTFKAFEDAVDNVIQGNFDDSDLEEAKLEMIQGLDAPISPGSRVEVAYSWIREGRTYEMRQAFRDKLLAMTRKEVIGAVERIIAKNMHKGSPVVFAGRELLEKANRDLLNSGRDSLLIEGV